MLILAHNSQTTQFKSLLTQIAREDPQTARHKQTLFSPNHQATSNIGAIESNRSEVSDPQPDLRESHQHHMHHARIHQSAFDGNVHQGTGVAPLKSGLAALHVAVRLQGALHVRCFSIWRVSGGGWSKFPSSWSSFRWSELLPILSGARADNMFVISRAGRD
jgi:hypothetical protein